MIHITQSSITASWEYFSHPILSEKEILPPKSMSYFKSYIKNRINSLCLLQDSSSCTEAFFKKVFLKFSQK